MGKFVITVRKNGEFQFNLKASNGQVILTSEGYTTKAACLSGIESVKNTSCISLFFDKCCCRYEMIFSFCSLLEFCKSLISLALKLKYSYNDVFSMFLLPILFPDTARSQYLSV